MDWIVYALIAVAAIAAIYAMIVFGLSRAQEEEHEELEQSVAVDEIDEAGPFTEIHRTESDKDLEEKGVDLDDEENPDGSR